jgi:DNA-binding transcriptional MerR regulator
MELSIGELARLTGLPVKTIRYYSDIGLVPEARRTDSGYRRYDGAGLARLELVRTLRDLGIDLAAIRRVADRHVTLEKVAGAHADAIDLHIRQLTLRRAVLRALARNGSRPEEVRRMTAFARASADEADRIMEDFLAAVFADREDDPFAERMRAGMPMLPSEPSDAQVDAWIELAGLVSDPSFRERVRSMVAEGARLRAAPAGELDEAAQAAGRMVTEQAGRAAERGVTADSAEGAAIVGELVSRFTAASGRKDEAGYRAELADQLATFSDRRVERYWQLIGRINGWPEQPSHVPAYEWFVAGLRA